MAETIIASVIAGVIMLIVGAIVGRISVRSKTAVSVDELGRELNKTQEELDKHIEVAEERNQIILESLLAILLTLKRGKCNGEADEALKRLNEYMLHQGSKN